MTRNVKHYFLNEDNNEKPRLSVIPLRWNSCPVHSFWAKANFRISSSDGHISFSHLLSKLFPEKGKDARMSRLSRTLLSKISHLVNRLLQFRPLPTNKHKIIITKALDVDNFYRILRFQFIFIDFCHTQTLELPEAELTVPWYWCVFAAAAVRSNALVDSWIKILWTVAQGILTEEEQKSDWKI